MPFKRNERMYLYLDNFSTSIFIFIVDENKINLMLYWLSFE